MYWQECYIVIVMIYIIHTFDKLELDHPGFCSIFVSTNINR